MVSVELGSEVDVAAVSASGNLVSFSFKIKLDSDSAERWRRDIMLLAEDMSQLSIWDTYREWDSYRE